MLDVSFVVSLDTLLKKTAEWPMIWNVMALIWRHCWTMLQNEISVSQMITSSIREILYLFYTQSRLVVKQIAKRSLICLYQYVYIYIYIYYFHIREIIIILL